MNALIQSASKKMFVSWLKRRQKKIYFFSSETVGGSISYRHIKEIFEHMAAFIWTLDVMFFILGCGSI